MSCTHFGETSQELPLFGALNEWLYRGGQPSEKGLAELRNKGIRTVVNFRNERDWIEWEQKEVEVLGMKYVSLPWSIWRGVKPELLDQFFEVLNDPANRPIFFHCKHGRDRSGVMAVLSLMRYEKLSKEEARSRAFEIAKPNLRYRIFVNRKINFFLRERAEKLS